MYRLGDWPAPFGINLSNADNFYFATLFIFLLELLIAFIQAYIFAVLTAVFIQLSRHPH